MTKGALPMCQTCISCSYLIAEEQLKISDEKINNNKKLDLLPNDPE